jgi:hypothetical protein
VDLTTSGVETVQPAGILASGSVRRDGAFEGYNALRSGHVNQASCAVHDSDPQRTMRNILTQKRKVNVEKFNTPNRLVLADISSDYAKTQNGLSRIHDSPLV